MARLLALLFLGRILYQWLVRFLDANNAVMQQSLATDEACRILGVLPDADEKSIKNAHRRLIKTSHPDQGGSAEYATRINLARDTLLKRLRTV